MNTPTKFGETRWGRWPVREGTELEPWMVNLSQQQFDDKYRKTLVPPVPTQQAAPVQVPPSGYNERLGSDAPPPALQQQSRSATPRAPQQSHTFTPEPPPLGPLVTKSDLQQMQPSAWERFWNDEDRVTTASHALMGAGAGLLEASAPSPVPISMGQAMARGIRGGLAGYSRGMELLDARNQRAAHKTAMERAEKLWPYQLAVQQAAGRKAQHDMLLDQNWSQMVAGSGATAAEQQQLMQVGSRIGFPALQKIVARGQRQQLTDAQRAQLPPQLDALKPFLYTEGGEIKAQPFLKGDMLKHVLQGQQGGYRPDPALRGQLGLPESSVVLSHPDPNRAPIIRDSPQRSLPQQSHDYVLGAQQDVAAGRRTVEDVQSDPEYGMHYANLYGRRQLHRWDDPVTGQMMQDFSAPLPAPQGIIPPSSAAQVPALQDATQPTMGSAQPISERPTTTPARKTKLLESLKSVEEAKRVLVEHRKHLREDEDTLGMLTKTGPTTAAMTSRAIRLQDILKDIGGYGAPQAGELLRLAKLITDPSDFDLHQWWKSGWDERAYALMQLKMTEDVLRKSEALSRTELGLGPAAPWGLELEQSGTATSTEGLTAPEIEKLIP